MHNSVLTYVCTVVHIQHCCSVQHANPFDSVHASRQLLCSYDALNIHTLQICTIERMYTVYEYLKFLSVAALGNEYCTATRINK